ncbi:SDR family NAD(P)-dependent oxidoreductase [Streptomyces brasiliensis]|uniref:3-oxoacyl-ACP reductase n=1 Tax=Streptomyces brasiliensis TaxID=1954 RepID=A0A917UMU8_9ACTN|nr:SDR family NAD(P)-dependent oxidoreductase [Streptomyces brasiliensis]GGJ68891.1 3-oxoacyl-ACP reductase [Streptomyces brasiliensis]
MSVPSTRDMTVVLTGATSGIGKAAARLLAPRVTRLIVHGPEQPDDVAALVKELRAANAGDVHYVHADYDRLAAVRALADSIAQHTDHVDVLINNAGRPGAPRRRLSADGNEATLQTNYLAAVLLTKQLTPLLLASAEPGGRVVNVASATHMTASLDPHDLNLEHSTYSATTAYARSELALVTHACWLASQAPPPQPDTVSLHPGVINTSLLHAMFSLTGEPTTRGAHNLVHAALATSRWGGRYLNEEHPVRPNPITLEPAFQEQLMASTVDLLRRAGAY